MLKIGIFTDLFHPRIIGGGENRLLHLASALAEKGHHIHVITSVVPGHPKKEKLAEGIIIHRIGIPHPKDGTSIVASILYLIHGIVSLRRFAALKLDVVESNTYLPAFLASLFSAITKTPHIMTIHDVYLTDWKYRVGLLLAPFAALIERGLRRLQYSKLVTVSESSKKKLTSMIGFDESGIEVIPNGVSFKEIDSTPPAREHHSVAFLGRLVPHKHVDHLIQAFCILKKASNESTLIIVGVGPERDNLEQLVEQLGVEESVTFAGFIKERDDVYSLLKNVDCLVNPSTVEGFGIALLEAMAAGAVPIVYDLPAYSDFVENGNNAIVVEPGDIRGLADSMIQVIGDESLKERLSQNGLQTAKSFSWSQIGKSVLELYRDAIKERFQVSIPDSMMKS